MLFYSTKEKLNIAKGPIKGIMLVPALGLMAHLFSGHLTNLTDNPELDCWTHTDYSLKHRFECAYKFNIPEECKYYTRTVGYWDDKNERWDNCVVREKYLASPYAMYPATLIMGVLGAMRAKRRIDKQNYPTR